MVILVTGGLGFIGSITARMLADLGHSVVVLDNGSGPLPSAREALKVPRMEIVEGDIRDESLLDHLFHVCCFDAVCHFAALSKVGEGEKIPSSYIDVNVNGTGKLLEAMRRAKVRRIFQASTSAVYGSVEGTATEDRPPKPESWYGRTKLWAEEIIREFAKKDRLRGFIFRFGNVAGAAYGVHEDRPDDDRLISKAVRAALTGGCFPVYGNDYPTPDGTCVRDYVHVLDVARAFVAGMGELPKPEFVEPLPTVNLSSARPVSVKEVLQTIAQVTGLTVSSETKDRRAGDPASVWLSNKRAYLTLRWEPTKGIAAIVEDFWNACRKVSV